MLFLFGVHPKDDGKRKKKRGKIRRGKGRGGAVLFLEDSFRKSGSVTSRKMRPQGKKFQTLGELRRVKFPIIRLTDPLLYRNTCDRRGLKERNISKAYQSALRYYISPL